jgi:N-acetylmuramoyl-L-alanine amidase
LDKQHNEKDFTLLIAQELKSYIQENCSVCNVELTRDGDQFLSLKKRTEIARNADLFISIHLNSAEEPSSTTNGFAIYTLSNSDGSYLEKDRFGKYKYIETFDEKDGNHIFKDYIPEREDMDRIAITGDKLAQSIAKEVNIMPFYGGNPIRVSTFKVLRESALNNIQTSILIEAGFMISNRDLSIIKDKNTRQILIRQMGTGIINHITNK